LSVSARFEASATTPSALGQAAGLDEGLRQRWIEHAERDELNRLRSEKTGAPRRARDYFPSRGPGSRRRPARCVTALQFVNEIRQSTWVAPMCRVGCLRQGYYAWRQRRAIDRARADCGNSIHASSRFISPRRNMARRDTKNMERRASKLGP